MSEGKPFETLIYRSKIVDFKEDGIYRELLMEFSGRKFRLSYEQGSDRITARYKESLCGARYHTFLSKDFVDVFNSLVEKWEAKKKSSTEDDFIKYLTD
jgi:hypothetical protein